MEIIKNNKNKEKNIKLQNNSFLAKLAKLLIAENGSDIIINADTHPVFKIDGKTKFIDSEKLTSSQTYEIAKNIMTEKQWTLFQSNNEINFMVDYPQVAQFRTNVFRQRGKIGIVIRLIPLIIPSIEELKLPSIIKEFSMLKRGLVLISGATGEGKSTSLAAMLDYRNQNISEHIITIEDPIEFMHSDKKSIVSQREVGIDTDSYSIALKSALRQSPDAILIGEIRNREVMEQALYFAETGHIVFATIHATTAKLTLERIVNMFSNINRKQLMMDLSHNLKAIVTQRLLMNASGKGRIVALEIMTNTPHIEKLIYESRLEELPDAMSRNSQLGGNITTIDDYIFDLYEKQKVTYKEASLYVESVNNFRVRLRSDSKLELPKELKLDDKEWNIE